MLQFQVAFSLYNLIWGVWMPTGHINRNERKKILKIRSDLHKTKNLLDLICQVDISNFFYMSYRHIKQFKLIAVQECQVII